MSPPRHWQALPDPRPDPPRGGWIDWVVVVDTDTQLPVTEPFSSREDALLWIADASAVEITDHWRIARLLEVPE
jgi:hypothetical protein